MSFRDQVHVDEIVAIPNVVQSGDLETILKLTQPDRRVHVALAFLGWTAEAWSASVGLSPTSVSHWTTGKTRLPYGGALRLARVMGVATELLFEHWQ